GALAVTGMEQAIGRPVVTSNQATAWNCLRLCSDETAHPEFGSLMTLPLPCG
ncbi:ectoine utilization protein EutA, partial [Mesorhizobium sp. M00.F.Ca.ET.158.01.1.1]